MSRHAIYSGSHDYVSELQRSYNAALIEVGEKAKQVAERDELIRDMLNNRCLISCAACIRQLSKGCEFSKRAIEMGIEVDR